MTEVRAIEEELIKTIIVDSGATENLRATEVLTVTAVDSEVTTKRS